MKWLLIKSGKCRKSPRIGIWHPPETMQKQKIAEYKAAFIKKPSTFRVIQRMKSCYRSNACKISAAAIGYRQHSQTEHSTYDEHLGIIGGIRHHSHHHAAKRNAQIGRGDEQAKQHIPIFCREHER